MFGAENYRKLHGNRMEKRRPPVGQALFGLPAFPETRRTDRQGRPRRAPGFRKSAAAAAVYVLSVMLALAALCGMPVRAEVVNSQATILTPEGWEDYAAEAAERRSREADTDRIPGWPKAPAVGAEGAILLEVNTGTVLYAKNMDEPLYPASTTKLMTCLIAMEQLDLKDSVTFSENAIYSVPYDGSNVGMDVGETITVEEALYCILVGSANEVANGIAEKTAGSLEAFAGMMNDRAMKLGCTHTHFVNAHGYHDDDHYTSAHDLALIAAEYFSDDARVRFANTPRYHMQATETQPDDFYINNKHKLINGELPYTGILGGKTGYTSLARETLVTCAEKNGMRLVCVVMKEEPGEQFTDTEALLDYGFTSFAIRNISAFEDRFAVSSPEFLLGGKDIIGYSSSFSCLDSESVVIMPAEADFDDLTARMAREGDTAEISYFFSGIPVGSALLTFEKPDSQKDAGVLEDTSAVTFKDRLVARMVTASDKGTLYVDVRFIVFLLGALTAGLLLAIFIIHGTVYIIQGIAARHRY